MTTWIGAEIDADYADTGVSIVNYYADTDKTTQTLLENFEGFSPILKEKSGKTITWKHLHTYSNSNNLKI